MLNDLNPFFYFYLNILEECYTYLNRIAYRQFSRKLIFTNSKIFKYIYNLYRVITNILCVIMKYTKMFSKKPFRVDKNYTDYTIVLINKLHFHYKIRRNRTVNDWFYIFYINIMKKNYSILEYQNYQFLKQ